MSHCCFENGCELEAKYVCLCLSSKTYSCELHLDSHLKLPNRIHALNFISLDLTEGSNDSIFGFITKEENISNSENLKTIGSDLKEVNSLIGNISQHFNENQLANPNILQYIPVFESDFSTIYDRWIELRSKRRDILNSAKNDQKIEHNFRLISSLYQNQSYASNPVLNQAYQEYANSYHQLTSLYLLDKNNQKMLIYDTEIEKEKINLINFPPEVKKESNFTCFQEVFRWCWEQSECITQLPNGELFCIYKEDPPSFRILIIDINGGFRMLPSKEWYTISSAIYFNRNIYCFGKRSDNHAISRRFDMDLYQWFKLTRMPRKGRICSCIMFKGNILISQFLYRRLTLYITEIDSFSIIPFKFSVDGRKILMSTNDRLYLIDCENKYIYESEDQFIWQIITKSNIRNNYCQVYCSHNKGGIYISTICQGSREYYRFDLDKKALIDIGYYPYI